MTLQEFVNDLNTRLSSGELCGDLPVQVPHFNIPNCTCEPNLAVYYDSKSELEYYFKNSPISGYIIHGVLR